MKEPQEIVLPPALREDLYEADALPEIAVLFDPADEVLEAYALEPSVGVIAIVSGGAKERRVALELGALEAFSPESDEDESRTRLASAVARFRSRIELEQDREHLASEQASLERNLRLAARLQRSLLPQELPRLESFEFSTAYLPRDFVSGDSYELRRLNERYVSIYTLDAVGHGVRAALLTVLLRAHFNPVDERGEPRDPALVLVELNRALLGAHLDESPTIAYCCALLDVQEARLRVACAGHPLPLRLPAEGKHEWLGDSGLLLGVDDMDYASEEFQLEPGDRVFLHSDGANTAYDDRLARELTLHRDLSLEDQIGGALGAVIELDDEGRPEDDITLVGFAMSAAATPRPAPTVQEDARA